MAKVIKFPIIASRTSSAPVKGQLFWLFSWHSIQHVPFSINLFLIITLTVALTLCVVLLILATVIHTDSFFLTVVEVVAVPAEGCACVGPFSQVIARLTGPALVTATPSAALTGGEAPFTAPTVAPEPSGTLWYTRPIEKTRTTAQRGQESKWVGVKTWHGEFSFLVIMWNYAQLCVYCTVLYIDAYCKTFVCHLSSAAVVVHIQYNGSLCFVIKLTLCCSWTWERSVSMWHTAGGRAPHNHRHCILGRRVLPGQIFTKSLKHHGNNRGVTQTADATFT